MVGGVAISGPIYSRHCRMLPPTRRGTSPRHRSVRQGREKASISRVTLVLVSTAAPIVVRRWEVEFASTWCWEVLADSAIRGPAAWPRRFSMSWSIRVAAARLSPTLASGGSIRLQRVETRRRTNTSHRSVPIHVANETYRSPLGACDLDLDGASEVCISALYSRRSCHSAGR